MDPPCSRGTGAGEGTVGEGVVRGSWATAGAAMSGSTKTTKNMMFLIKEFTSAIFAMIAKDCQTVLLQTLF